MAYSEKVIEHYEKPRNVGSLDSRSNRVGTGLVGAPECGDVMKLQIEVDEKTKLSMQSLKHLDVVVQSHPVLLQQNG